MFSLAGFSAVKVGEPVMEKFETPHPYKGNAGVVVEKIYHYPNAGYISLHFSHFNLAPGDFVEIFSGDEQIRYVYRGKGKVVNNGTEVISEFWASHIPGDTAVLRLHSKNPSGGWGFAIDQWVRGFEKERINQILDGMASTMTEPALEPGQEAICSNDDKEWAKCYDGTTMYDKARAVARLLMNGSSACTGWLVGSEGHLMTNNHCIGNQSTANNTDYEFMAEGATCATNCTGWLACPGIVEATSGTLVKTNSSLDYTLVLLPVNLTGTYGYLQLRDTLPILDERIYIPQHPGAYGKQLAVNSDVDGPLCKIYSTNQAPCTGGPGDIGYYCDTAGGSSGSPVLAYSDHLVVSLHHCANCPNRGLPIPDIISDLGASLPNDAIGGGVVNPPAAPTGLTATAVDCNRIDLAWTDNSDNETLFSIERSDSGGPFAEIDTVGPNVTSYSDTSVAAETTYSYRVRAYNSAGYSAYTNTDSATTGPCTGSPPAAPTITKVKPGPGKVTIQWADNANNENGYRIYRGLSSGSLSLVATISANSTQYVDNGLARKTTYYYKVCAYNAYGEGCSGEFSATTK
jgi:hypothetical protein